MIGNILGGAMGKALPQGDFESIATVTVGAGGSSTITFSSIPSTYTNLQIRGICKGSQTAWSRVRFNGDTGSNYFSHSLEGSGSAANSYPYPNITGAYLFPSGLSITTNIFTGFVVDILDYKDGNKNKTLRSINGQDTNGGGTIYFASGGWNNTAAITSIDFVITAGTFSQYSHFALYGIKG